MRIARSIISVFLSGMLLSCQGQVGPGKPNLKNKTTMDQHLSNEFERLDVKDFIAKAKKTEGQKLTDNDELLPVVFYEYRTESSSGNPVRITGDQDEIQYKESLKNSYFNLVKHYYSNGNIKTKGLTFNVESSAFKKGIWHTFSQEGKITGSVNYDDAFKYSFEELVRWLEYKNISLKKGPLPDNPGRITTINRSNEKGSGPVWEVIWLKSSNELETILINGVTGKVISTKQQKFHNS